MNEVERIKEMLKIQGIPVSRLEKDLGFSNGYISQLKSGKIPASRLYKISSYLGVAPEYILFGMPTDDADVNETAAREMAADLVLEHGGRPEGDLYEADDLIEDLQLLRDNPARRALLRSSKGLTKDQIEMIGQLMEQMRRGN